MASGHLSHPGLLLPAHWVEAFQKGFSWLGTDNLAQLHAASDMGNTQACSQVETGLEWHSLHFPLPALVNGMLGALFPEIYSPQTVKWV